MPWDCWVSSSFEADSSSCLATKGDVERADSVPSPSGVGAESPDSCPCPSSSSGEDDDGISSSSTLTLAGDDGNEVGDPGEPLAWVLMLLSAESFLDASPVEGGRV